jgi:hypothetical protein
MENSKLYDTEQKLQSWLYDTDLGVIVGLLLSCISVFLGIGIGSVPMVLTLIYLNHWWLLLTFPLTMFTMGISSVWVGLHMIEWVGGDISIFTNYNKK